MIKVTSDIIDECAENLLFKISPEEKEKTLEEFDAILKQMSYLGKIPNIDKAEPLTFPVKDVQFGLRDDVPCQPLDVNEELKMVPNRLGNQVKLPKVVG